MRGCPPLSVDGPGGIAAALRSVDCVSSQATAVAFGRLFGVESQLGLVLTAMLTLFIGWFAVGLLTGRTRLSLASLSPRLMTLMLVLTFATSWLAYQSVVWNLATGAPDQIAGVLTGARGSATMQFAGRLDQLFAAIAEVAATAQSDASVATAKSIATPADMLWLGALLLLIGTVGVLLVARIALAALLALGPVFIVLSLFDATRGLFHGWLRGVAMLALVPLFTVLIGGGAMAMLSPVVSGLGAGELTMRSSVTVFLAAIVYCGLMLMVFRTVATIAAGWGFPSAGTGNPYADGQPPVTHPAPETRSFESVTCPVEGDRIRAILAGFAPIASSSPDPSSMPHGAGVERLAGAPVLMSAPPGGGAVTLDGRAKGLGNLYRHAATSISREITL